MYRSVFVVIFICVGICLIVSSDNLLVAQNEGNIAKASKPAQTPIVAIIPPISRGDQTYATLSPAFTAMVGSILEQSGEVVVVDRTSMGKVFDEKDLAGLELTDREILARTGQLIDANYVLTGYYDVRDGQVQIQTNLISVADWIKHKEDIHNKLNIIQMSGKFPADLQVQAAQNIAKHVLESVKAASGTVPTSSVKSSLSKDKTLAVFSLSACPLSSQLEQSAGVLADMLGNDLQEILSIALVEREKLENILAEKKLQLVGMTARNKAMLASKLLGADYLLTGSLVRAGKNLRIDVQLLDVLTGAVVASASEDTTNDKLMGTHEKLAQTMSPRVGAGLKRLASLGKSPSSWRTAEAQIQAEWAETLLKINKDRDERFVSQMSSLIRVALDLAPEDGPVNTSAGVVADRLGNRTAAEPYLRKGVELSPDDPTCNLRYARLLMLRRSTPKTAMKHIRKAIDCFLAGKNIPVDELHRTVPGDFIRTMIYCCLGVGDLKESHRWAVALVYSGDSTEETNDAIVAVAVAEGKCAESALMLRLGGSKNLALINRLMRLSGNIEEQQKYNMEMLRRGYLDTNQRLELAEQLKESNPELAAALCRRIILHKGWKKELPRPPADPRAGYTRAEIYPEYWAVHHKVTTAQADKAKAILEKAKKPIDQPLITGPVFDIDSLRKRGIKYALVKYEKFPYEKHLPYVKDFLEDIYGIPIAFNEGFRVPPEKPFDHLHGVIHQTNEMEKDLGQAREEVGGVAVTGLMGHSLTHINRDKHDLIYYTTDKSMVSTTLCAGVTPSTHAAEPFIVGYMLRNLSFCVGTRVMPRNILREVQPSCLTQTCVLSLFATRERELVPCPVCRQEIYEFRKDWPKGKPERDSIVAGPAKPALDDNIQSGEILLIPMDVSAEQAYLNEVALCIKNSLGLRCIIHDRIDRKNSIPAIPKSLADISPKLKGLDKQYAAICILTGKRFSEKPWSDMLLGEAEVVSHRRWRVWVPELEEPGPKVNSPLIIVSVNLDCDFNLPFCYCRMETFNVKNGGDITTIQAPAYAKLLIGALAITARKDHECWTLGCPTTVWESIGAPHRCSHYLCPECRKAVCDYYKSPKK